jgi:hypothetical protein
MKEGSFIEIYKFIGMGRVEFFTSQQWQNNK